VHGEAAAGGGPVRVASCPARVQEDMNKDRNVTELFIDIEDYGSKCICILRLDNQKMSIFKSVDPDNLVEFW